MAKNRAKGKRGNFSTSNRRLLSPAYATPRRFTLPKFRSLTLYEDRRLWHPEGIYAPAKSFSRPRHRLIVPARKVNNLRFNGMQKLWKTLPVSIGFHAPSRVLICVRRRIRKEIMHAFGIAGSRGSQKPHKRNAFSNIHC